MVQFLSFVQLKKQHNTCSSLPYTASSLKMTLMPELALNNVYVTFEPSSIYCDSYSWNSLVIFIIFYGNLFSVWSASSPKYCSKDNPIRLSISINVGFDIVGTPMVQSNSSRLLQPLPVDIWPTTAAMLSGPYCTIWFFRSILLQDVNRNSLLHLLHLASKVILKPFLFTSPISLTGDLQAALCHVIVWMVSWSLCKLLTWLPSRCE